LLSLAYFAQETSLSHPSIPLPGRRIIPSTLFNVSLISDCFKEIKSIHLKLILTFS
jgi:hypothetical protein